MSEKKITRRKAITRLLAGTAAGVVSGTIASKGLEGLVLGIDGTIHETTANWKYGRGPKDKDYNNITACLPYIDKETRIHYHQDRKERKNLYEEAQAHLETLQRLSHNTPGVNSKPIKGLRDTKKKILSWTKSFFTDKEEVKAQAKEEYKKKYNHLSTLQVELKNRIATLDEEQGILAYKIIRNNYNTGVKDEEGLQLLETLLQEQHSYHNLLRDFKELKPTEIVEGEQNKEFTELMKKTQTHNLQPYKPKTRGINTLIGVGTGTAIGALTIAATRKL